MVDEGPHPAGDDAHLVLGPTADRVDELETHKLGQATQAEHPTARRLAHARRPGTESPAIWPAGSSPELKVRRAEAAFGMGHPEVATGHDAWPEIAQPWFTAYPYVPFCRDWISSCARFASARSAHRQ